MNKLQKQIIKDIHSGAIINFDSFIDQHLKPDKNHIARSVVNGSNGQLKAGTPITLLESELDADQKAEIFFDTIDYLRSHDLIAFQDNPNKNSTSYYYLTDSEQYKQWNIGAHRQPRFMFENIVPDRKNIKKLVNRHFSSKSESTNLKINIIGLIFIVLTFIFTIIVPLFKKNIQNDSQQSNSITVKEDSVKVESLKEQEK